MKAHIFTLLFSVLVAVSFLLAFLIFVFAPPELPLWYSVSIAEQQLDKKIFIFLFPLLIVAIALLHSFFMKRVNVLDPYLHSLFFYASVVPIGILSIALIHILTVAL